MFQLEHSKLQLEAMKDQYEQKMATLQERIRRTEAERDQVLDNLTNTEQAAEDVTLKVQDLLPIVLERCISQYIRLLYWRDAPQLIQ